MIFLPTDSWEIKKTAQKGRGLFALKHILPGTIIGDYLGKVLNPLQDDLSEKDEGLYLMYYHDKALIYPSAVSASGVHVINHSCMPNNWIYTFKGHALFFTLRHIYPWEELTISYLLAPNSKCNPCPHQCYCNTSLCTGSMHLSNEVFSRWQKYSSTQSKQTRKSPVRYGLDLPLLKQYPANIDDHNIYPLYGSDQVDELILTSRQIPAKSELRKIIRISGKKVSIPALQLKVIGIENNAVISQKI